MEGAMVSLLGTGLILLVALSLALGLVSLYRLFKPRAAGIRGAQRDLIGCLGRFLLFVLAVALLLPAISTAPEARRRSQCTRNLKAIMLAMRTYHDTYGCFPPAYTVDKGGRPLHSWRVLLLPFLQQDGLYRSVRLDEPYDSPHNRALFESAKWRDTEGSAASPCFFCPADRENRTDTNYVMLVGPRTISNGPNSVRLKDITDDPATTILVVEVYDLGIRWYEPRDLRVDQMSFRINDPDYHSIASRHVGGFGGAQALFADGHVEYLWDKTDPRMVEAMTTINGGEDVSAVLNRK
jgi:prepilin-type processing-associated H-X9-DG protein